MSEVTDEQLADIFRVSFDERWGAEFGSNYHQGRGFSVKADDGAFILGTNGDDFYAVPINIARFRDGLKELGLGV